MHNIDVSYDQVKIYYTNADSLLNKLDELEVVIELNNPDIIVITEVFPKNVNACEIDRNEYKIGGYQCFTGNIEEHSRGVAIYIKDHIPADYCKVLANESFKEYVFCELRLEKKGKVATGSYLQIA